MKNRIILQAILALVILVLIAGCERKSRLDNLSKDELIKKMQPVRDKLNKAMVENDIDLQASYYSDDILRLDPNKPMRKGKDSWLASSRQLVKDGFQIKSAQNEIVEIWASGNLIYEIGIAKLEIFMPGMTSVQADEGKYFCVWKSNPDGSLKIMYSMWNTNKPVEALNSLR